MVNTCETEGENVPFPQRGKTNPEADCGFQPAREVKNANN